METLGDALPREIARVRDEVQLKEFIKDAMFDGWTPAATETHESFIFDAAKVKQERDELLDALNLVREFGCPGSTDDGIDIAYLCDKAIDKAEGKIK